MKLADFHRLKKMMARADSENDHESLAAVRAANALLKKEGLDWERVLDRSVKVMMPVEDVSAPEEDPRPDRKRIDAMFDEIEEAGPRGRTADTVADLRTWWTEKGFLTKGQAELVEKILERARNGWRRE